MRPLSPRHASRQHGSTLLGVIIGLVIGLAIALVVAIYITNAPVPFLNKVQRPTDNAPAAEHRRPPARSQPRAVRQRADAQGRCAESRAGEGGTAESRRRQAGCARQDRAGRGRHALPVAGRRLQARRSTPTRCARAWRCSGLDAKVYPIEQGGSTFYRVRVGPYSSIDDINRIRKLMAENNIEAQVVRLK